LEQNRHQFYTQSDTEVIVHAYEEYGEDCVKYLRGQFAFCVYDSREELLFLARDHMGLKPLYYYFDRNKFIFGSEIKSILCHNIKREVNKNALNYYLSLKYVPFHNTLFRGIYKVPPSSYLIFDLKRKKLSINKFWTLKFDVNKNRNVNQIAKELRRIIEESVSIRLMSDVPLGAFLSGGIDSSIIVGLMSKLLEEPVKTFSIGFEGSPVDETKYSRVVAEHFDTDHTEIIVRSPSYHLLPKIIWHLDDLIADGAVIPVHIMAKHARERMTVALTGDGADEVFAGYSAFYQRQKFNFMRSIPDGILNLFMKFYNKIPLHLFRIGISYLEQSKTLKDRYLRKIIHVPDIDKIKIFPFKAERIKPKIQETLPKSLDNTNQFTFWDLLYQLPNQFNMKVDKMTMAASLEARTPFLDVNIVEYATTIPTSLKLKGNIEKYILRLSMKDLLPPLILKRKKRGFNTPLNYWLKTGLKEVFEILMERLEKRKDLFNPRFIKSVKRNRRFKIFENRAWNLLMFELWYETYFENDGFKPIRI